MTEAHCPHCRRQVLEPVYEQGVEIDACVHCGGLWFDAGELAKVMNAYDGELAPSGAVVDSLGPKIEDTVLACPACHAELARHALSAENSLPVDVCLACHGVWLERDELAHARAGHLLPQAEAELAVERTRRDWLFQFVSGLPVEFNFRPRRLAVVTICLIVLNCAAFLLELTAADPERLVSRFGLIPAHAPGAHWLMTLVTSCFLHADPIHLAGNMYFLWILGDNVEDAFGRTGYLGLYFLVAVAGGLAVTISPVDPEMPRLGASGAVSGIMAAYAVMFRRSKLTFMFVIFQYKLPAAAWVTLWVLFNIGGFVVGAEGIAWEGHLGGFVCGLVVALAAYRPLLRRNPLVRLLNQATV